MARKPIQAAGGIVVRKGGRPLLAVVQRAKDDKWVLPRGKLKRNERPQRAAEREVVEETGHKVKVSDYAGAMLYRAQGKPKVVQFWHMKAAHTASLPLMKDISAVAWLPLKKAIRRLSYPLEKMFLDSISGMPKSPGARKTGKAAAKRKSAKRASKRKKRV